MSTATIDTPAPVLVNTIVPQGGGKGRETSSVLTDGEKFYCSTEGCEYQAEKWASVFAHRRFHAPRRVEVKSGYAPLVVALEGPLEDLIQARVGDAKEQTEKWRKRALAAEADLKSIRRIMGTVA